MRDGILAHGVIIAAYGAAAWLLWRRLRPAADRPGAGGASARSAADALVPVALAGHATLLFQDILTANGPDLGFGNALALVAWLSTLIAWLATLVRPQPGLLAMLLPASAIAAAVPLAMPPQATFGGIEQPIAALHVAIALIAYALFVVAVLQAVVLLWLEKRLHSGSVGTLPSGVPPLLTLERFVFQLTAGAFLMLTLTLASGILFTEALFGRALRFNHKTVFSILAWLVFAGLLFGRYRYGWRGRVALRWLLAGSALLLLAYLGTKFVLEVVLGR